MIADTLVCLLLVFGVAFGLCRPLADRLGLAPADTVVAGVGLSLLLAWLYAWLVFISGLNLAAYGALPVLGFVFLTLGRKKVAGILADPAARSLVVGQLLVTGWSVCWLSFVKNQSGGAWIGDSNEHWERALYYLRLWGRDQTFIGVYTLSARPPLANVLVAAFMGMTKVDFAHYQVISAILSSLAFLPVGLIAIRLGGERAARIATVIVMLNPLFIQNCTYPWTKLPAAFFVLAGLHFFLRVRSRDQSSRICAVLCGILLGAGVVTHYSAGPYVLAIGVAWLFMGWRRDWADGLGQATLLAALGGALVLAPWFGWSIAQFGLGGTFLSNTSVSMMQAADQSLPVTMALNFRDSVIPPQVRGFHGTLFIQSSPWGSLRDQAFLVYQTNLVLALGSIGSLVVLWQLVRAFKAASYRNGAFWAALIGSFILLCLATYGDHDHYGNAHVCMQSIVLLGLAFLASRWGTLGTGWKVALALGWAADFIFGIALQFAVEDFAIDRWLTPDRNLAQVVATYGPVARENFAEKIIAHEAFFSDILTTQPAIMLALVGALLCMALVRARGAPAAQKSP